MLDVLRLVQAEAQKRHQYMTDKEQHGKHEHWEPNLMGDCEDYALWCREALEKRGIKSNLIFCRVVPGDPKAGHCVLSVKGWILDCLREDVVSRKELEYEWISLGKPDGTWRDIIG